MGEKRQREIPDTRSDRHKYRGTREKSGIALKRVIDYMLECVFNRRIVKPPPA